MRNRKKNWPGDDIGTGNWPPNDVPVVSYIESHQQIGRCAVPGGSNDLFSLATVRFPSNNRCIVALITPIL